MDYLPTEALIAQITRFFEWSPQRVWTRDQLRYAIWECCPDSQSMPAAAESDPSGFLLENTSLVQIMVDLPHRPTLRYCWGTPTPHELAMSLRPSGYFSHQTAMHFHGLSAREP